MLAYFYFIKNVQNNVLYFCNKGLEVKRIKWISINKQINNIICSPSYITTQDIKIDGFEQQNEFNLFFKKLKITNIFQINWRNKYLIKKKLEIYANLVFDKIYYIF